MRIAFVCCTPYHIILSVHLSETVYKNYEKDIFICNHFNNSYEVFNELKQQSNWRKVFFVEDHEINYDKSFLKCKKISFFLNKDIKQIIDTENESVYYDEICIFTHNIFSKMLFENAQNLNGNLKINYIEEGTSTYTLIEPDNLKNKMLNILVKLLKRKVFSNKDITDLHLFKPELYIGDSKKDLNKIPHVDKSNTLLLENLNNIFSYDPLKIPYDNYNCIYFDQTISKDGEININEKEFLAKMIEHTTNKKLIVKLHPRDSKDKYQQYPTIKAHSDGSIPWELIYFNENLEDMTLISIRSSSVFTPKIMFNKENKIVLLYKIAGIKDELFERFVDSFKKLYREDKIFIPENWKEFEEVIRKD
ncbi:hypothetical protein [Cytobacillus firmus]|uniref:hypothetical protein n=1 Tax=Cytobacillus firmus TaxID=1399 RepID=UPI00300319BF